VIVLTSHHPASLTEGVIPHEADVFPFWKLSKPGLGM